MKKLLYSLAAIAVTMFAASCAQERLEVPSDGETVKATFTVNLPDGVATKTISDGLNATELLFRAYNESNVVLPGLSKTVTVSNRKATIEVDLVKDLQYQFVFWAQTPGKYSIPEDGQTITVTPSMNDGDADAFYWHEPIFEVTAAFNKEITLTRPFAQINVGAVAGDFTAAAASQIATDANLKTGYTITGVPTQLNLITGAVGETVDISGASVDNCASHPTEQLTVGSVNYDYAAMLYVLAPAEKETKTVTVDIWTKQTVSSTNVVDKHFTREVPNVPIQRNYRTNILGRIFTVGGTFEVTVDQNFTTVDTQSPDYVPEYATIADLNAAFAADPAQAVGYRVAVTTPETGTVVLPKTNDDVRIFFRGDWSSSDVTLTYAEGATASEKPANVYVLAPNLNKLAGDITATHVEIETGSDIAEGNLKTSTGSLVIQVNARMGILEVGAGSLKVDGEVEKATIKLAAAEAGSTVTKTDDGEIIELIIEKGTVVVNGEYEKVTATGADANVSVPSGSVVNNLTAVSGSQVDVDGNVDVVVATGDGTVVDLSNANEIGTITEDGNATVITDPSYVSANVAAIGETEYATLAEAVAAAPEGAETTIKILNNTAIIGNAGITIPANKNIVIDLNGFTVSNRVNENKASQVFANKGTLSLKNTAATEGTVTNAVLEGTQAGEWWSTPKNNYATNVITNTGTLNIEDGVVVNQTAAGSICYAVDNNSTSFDAILNVKGGTLTGFGTVVRQFCNSTTKKNEVNVSGGEITTEGSAALWIQLPGSSAQKKMAALNVTGGTLKGRNYAFYDYSYGDLFDNVQYTISGGSFIGGVFSYGANINITGGAFSSYVAIKQTKPSAVSVSGGTFGDEVYTYGDNASTGFITGGTFNVNPVEFVKTPSYCVYTNDEEYIVLPSSAAIPAGYYAIIADGIAFIPESNTYNLSAGANMSLVISDGKARGLSEFTINLSEGSYNMCALTTGAAVNIKFNGKGENTEIHMENAQYNASSCTLEFNDVKLLCDKKAEYKGFIHGVKEIYNNCYFTGVRHLYALTTEFNNCHFAQDTYQYCVFVYGTNNCTFNNCTFDTAGKTVKVYKETESVAKAVTFEGCTFATSADAAQAAMSAAGKSGDWKTAIEIDGRAIDWTININNCTETGHKPGEVVTSSTLFNVDAGSSNTKVVIDGVQQTKVW